MVVLIGFAKTKQNGKADTMHDIYILLIADGNH